jgi:hypothetical protein
MWVAWLGGLDLSILSGFRGYTLGSYVLGMAGAVAIAGFGLVPALAEETVAVSTVAVSTAAVSSETVSQNASVVPDRTSVAANDALEPGSVARLPITRPTAAPKSKVVRMRQRPAVGPEVQAQQHWNCSGPWCGRQFVLMLGIAY